ncbi:glycosyltransferase family 2 protein [Candidatus Micrarchaeota archaeon]|nr:glycosyltransferase family 2 protein [Candidatus Micrarchaeota archaeon]
MNLNKRAEVELIMPTLNEEKGIKEVFKRIPETVGLLIVDGNSNDGTLEIVRKNKQARLIIEKRKGYGRAYKTGFEKTKAEIIVTMDGDASYPTEEIERLVEMLEREKLDFITCNRFGKLEEGSMSRINLLGNMILTMTANVLFSINLKDSQSGMWVFRKKILKDIMPESDGMAFSQEIKIRAFKKVKCKEVPITYSERIGRKKLNAFRDGLKNLMELFKLRLKI